MLMMPNNAIFVSSLARSNVLCPKMATTAGRHCKTADKLLIPGILLRQRIVRQRRGINLESRVVIGVDAAFLILR